MRHDLSFQNRECYLKVVEVAYVCDVKIMYRRDKMLDR